MHLPPSTDPMQPIPSMICLLGAPGAGKGVQGRLLAGHLGAVHVSVGDVMRQLREQGTKIPYDSRLRLAQTAFTSEAIRRAAPASSPVVLDGFPRAAEQVQALVDLPWRCQAVLWLEVSFAEAIARMKGRGREGEDVAQIGLRHARHEARSPELLDAIASAGIPVHRIDADAEIEQVQARCRAAVLSTEAVDIQVD